MYSKEYLSALAANVGSLNFDPPIEVGKPDTFGLGLEIFDPVSGQIITVARPQRADIGQTEILLNAAQVAQAVNGARLNRLHVVRAAGFASIAAADEHDKRVAEAAALKAKHDEERAALEDHHAADAAKLAADQQPKPADKPSGKPADDPKARDGKTKVA